MVSPQCMDRYWWRTKSATVGNNIPTNTMFQCVKARYIKFSLLDIWHLTFDVCMRLGKSQELPFFCPTPELTPKPFLSFHLHNKSGARL